jgi:hypothetical protein
MLLPLNTQAYLISGRVADELLVQHVLQKFDGGFDPADVLHAVQDPDDSLVS